MSDRAARPSRGDLVPTRIAAVAIAALLLALAGIDQSVAFSWPGRDTEICAQAAIPLAIAIGSAIVAVAAIAIALVAIGRTSK